MRTSITSIVSTLAIILFALFALAPGKANAFPLSLPDLNGLSSRSPVAASNGELFDFSRFLVRRKKSGSSFSSGKTKSKSKKKFPKGAIAGIVIGVIIIILIIIIILYLRRRKARGH
ncbi:MAG: hypothetical protein M1825_005238 [Sarcosagium campestre]|nr:MAG: hypothetical protein M1825_005238 [Sarcosagium campestre]